MFPHIQAHNREAGSARNSFTHQRRILVSSRNHRQFIAFQHQPCPAGTKAGSCRFFKFCFEVINGAEVTFDSRFQVTLQGGAFFQTFPEQAVVSVGTKNYKTLAAAINAAQNGDTVVLKQDVTESVRIPAGKEITLDLAGKNIESNSEYGTVVSEGQLTVKDSTATAKPVVNDDHTVTYVSGKITNTHGKGSALRAANGGEIILESGSVESTSNIGVYAQGNYTPGGETQHSKSPSRVVTSWHRSVRHPHRVTAQRWIFRAASCKQRTMRSSAETAPRMTKRIVAAPPSISPAAP